MEPKTYPASPHPEPEAIIVFCGDPRFQGAIASFISEELHLQPGEFLPFSVPGGIASLSEQFARPKDFKVLKEGLEFYLTRLRTIRKVILINHEDCKKYHDLCERLGPSSLLNGNIPDRQRNDLHKVSQVVLRIIPEQIEVQRYYAKFANPEHTQVTFEQV
jgi:hypothetical protein